MELWIGAWSSFQSCIETDLLSILFLILLISVRTTMTELHKGDVCLNHAMAVNVGHSIPCSESNTRDIPSLGLSQMYTKLLAFLDVPKHEDSYFETFIAHNIPRHSTSISSLVKGGKRYVWYNNPWGYGGDVYGEKHTLYEKHEWKFLSEESKNSFVDLDLSNISKNVPASLRDRITDPTKLKMLGRRLQELHSMLPEHRFKDIRDRFTTWRYPNGDPNAPHQHYPGKTETPLPNLHVMSILQLLKLMTDSEHLVVVHPFDSMTLRGPQDGDGIDDQTKKIEAGRGACTLWSVIYMRKARRDTTRLLEKSVLSEDEVINHIKNTLTEDPFDGEGNPRLALSKNMQEIGGQKHWKTILSTIYDMIPDIGHAFNPDAGPRYSKRARKRVSETSRFSSEWHGETLWKLDLIENLVYDKIEHLLFNGDSDSFEVTPNAECAAGFIEAIYVVASPEARAHPAYLEEVGRIMTFVVKSKVHSFSSLQFFVSMLKLLISCKHDESLSENTDRERQSYPLPTLTRADRESAKELLRKHAEAFGYGAAGDSDFVEDRRKKPRDYPLFSLLPT